jgi:oligoribonuclease NrnB/cAMP/cGMP phosphodiesterase (DHH superfamily)
MENVICVFHSSDFDGKCGAAIIRKRYPDCELYQFNYGQEIDWERLRGRKVIMVDISFPMEDMKKIANDPSTGIQYFIWLDHHKSSTDDAEKQGLFDDFQKSHIVIQWALYGEQAGCEIAWNACFPVEEMPLAVHLLGRYDIWDHSDPMVVPFQWGLRLHEDTFPDHPIWKSLLDTSTDSVIEEIVKEGEIVLKYYKAQNKIICYGGAFETTLHGPSMTDVDDFDAYKCLALNAGGANSMVMDSIWDPENYAMMVFFYWHNSGQWVVSLRTGDEDSNIDCSKIAKHYGGGGHPGAAGFRCDKLPFELGKKACAVK